MNRLFRRLVFGVSLGLLVVLLGGEFGLRAVRAGSDDKGAYRQIEVYSEVLKKIQTDYVTVPSVPDVTAGALHGLVESLDSDSSYLSASEYKIYKERPSGGSAQVGMTISKRFGYAVVVSVLPDSPAAKAHFTDGDVIVAIDGHSTRELSPALLDVMLEGKAGSEVTLSVLRPRKTEPDKVALTRVAAEAPPMGVQQYEGDTILYLKPEVLTAARVDEIAARIKTMVGAMVGSQDKGKDRKIVLDLRDVSTGGAEQGLRLANLFLKQGTLATLSGQKFPTQTFTADPKAFVTDAPLAVLVNRGTAGAAELAAAALGDDKRADVVGERTFGDDSVQKTMELPDGAAVILTVATYASPSGKKIMEEAVTPTVVVGSTEDQDVDAETPAAPKSDETLDKALELLKAKAA